MIYNKYDIIGILIASIESDLMVLSTEQRCEFRKRIAMMEVNKFNKMVADRIGEYTELEKDIIKKNNYENKTTITRRIRPSFSNIRQIESITDNIRNSSYYTIYGNEEQRAHDVEIQNKCLEYFGNADTTVY